MKPIYEPTWAGTVKHEERIEAFRKALDRLDAEDHKAVVAAMRELKVSAKAMHVRHFGEQGALELTAAVGMWLARQRGK